MIKHEKAFLNILEKRERKTPDNKKIKGLVKQIYTVDSQYTKIKTNNVDAFDYYFGINYMDDSEDGRSKVYTSDLADTVEWILPSHVRIFAGGDDVASLSPRRQEHSQQVQNHNELVNYQIKSKNKWFIIINDWIRDALLLKRGIVKYQWVSEKETDEKIFEDVTDIELQTHRMNEDVVSVEVLGQTEVVPAQYDDFGEVTLPAQITYKIKVNYEFEDEYPLIEVVPPEEVGFPVDTRSRDDCRFLYHRTTYDKWQFINRFSKEKFKKVKEYKESFLNTIEDFSVEQERYTDIEGLSFFYDFAEDKWIVYECYYPNPENGTPWVTFFCGNVELESEKNKYKKPPFQIITPIKLSHRLIGMSMYDLLKDLQKIHTALMRQMLDNIYFNNNGRTLLNPNYIDVNEWLDGMRPGGIVPTKDGMPASRDAFLPIDTPQLPAWAFSVLELVQQEKDYHTGVPRSFQGVTNDTLNKTMRGQNQQIQMAEQRIEMMARLFAEMGIAPLIRDIVDMNYWFMTKPVALRVVDEWIDVSPEDVVAKADVIINVGLGTTSKDTQVAQNQQMIALYMQLYQIFGNSLDSKIVHAMEQLVKAMGYRDTQNWVPEASGVPNLQNLGGANPQGTQPGQETSPQATQPANPTNPNVLIPNFEQGYFG